MASWRDAPPRPPAAASLSSARREPSDAPPERSGPSAAKCQNARAACFYASHPQSMSTSTGQLNVSSYKKAAVDINRPEKGCY